MIRILTISAALLLAAPSQAQHEDPPGFPGYDTVTACSTKLYHPAPALVRVCITDEGEARDAALYLWPALPPDVQTHCVIVAQLTVPAPVRYQSLHNCLSELAASQRELGGEIPVPIRKNWLDVDIRALKAGHY